METVGSIKIGDYGMGEKGLDFGYNFVIVLYRVWKKLAMQTQIGIDVMIVLFDSFVVY